MSAGHRERAQMINNRLGGHEQTSTLVLRRYVRLSVGWLSRTATRRPDKSSRLVTFPTVPTPPFWEEDFARAFWLPLQANTLLPLSHSVEKRNFVRPLTRVPLLAPFPSCTPLLGPMPSGAYVALCWGCLRRGCP